MSQSKHFPKMRVKHVRPCYLVQMVDTLHGLMMLVLKFYYVKLGRSLLKSHDLKSVLFNFLPVAHISQLGNHPLVINFKLHKIQINI